MHILTHHGCATQIDKIRHKLDGTADDAAGGDDIDEMRCVFADAQSGPLYMWAQARNARCTVTEKRFHSSVSVGGQ
jgi:hypothetical protein